MDTFRSTHINLVAILSGKETRAETIDATLDETIAFLCADAPTSSEKDRKKVLTDKVKIAKQGLAVLVRFGNTCATNVRGLQGELTNKLFVKKVIKLASTINSKVELDGRGLGTLLEIYIQHGKAVKARKLFASLKERDMVTAKVLCDMSVLATTKNFPNLAKNLVNHYIWLQGWGSTIDPAEAVFQKFMILCFAVRPDLIRHCGLVPYWTCPDAFHWPCIGVNAQMSNSGECSACNSTLNAIPFDWTYLVDKVVSEFSGAHSKVVLPLLDSFVEKIGYVAGIGVGKYALGAIQPIVIIDAANIALGNKATLNVNFLMSRVRAIKSQGYRVIVVAQRKRSRKIGLQKILKPHELFEVHSMKINDDTCFMYLALQLNCLLLTNDKLHDHFALDDDLFTIWKETHIVSMNVRNAQLTFPTTYSPRSQCGKTHAHVAFLNGTWLCTEIPKKPAVVSDDETPLDDTNVPLFVPPVRRERRITDTADPTHPLPSATASVPLFLPY